jgi:Lon protease-like protein
VSAQEPLPLFPLHTVLFPGGALPLHIFEPRYRLMVSRCLEAEAPFGVVLISKGRESKGREVGDPATPYSVGTLARIVHHERLDDGRMNLVCVGGERFRILELRHDQPYLSALVEPLAELPEETPLELAEQVRAALDRFRANLADRPGLRLPGDPTALSFALAGAIPLPHDQAQALLAETSTSARLRALLEILEREARLRDRVGLTRPAAPGQIRPLSPN